MSTRWCDASISSDPSVSTDSTLSCNELPCSTRRPTFHAPTSSGGKSMYVQSGKRNAKHELAGQITESICRYASVAQKWKYFVTLNGIERHGLPAFVRLHYLRGFVRYCHRHNFLANMITAAIIRHRRVAQRWRWYI